MALGPRLDLRQSQSLVMTPQLRQAIKLLQFTNLEVAAFVEEELERNPLLERDERPTLRRTAAAPDQRRSRAAPSRDTADLAGADEPRRERGADPLDAASTPSRSTPAAPVDGDRLRRLAAAAARRFRRRRAAASRTCAARPRSLREHLGEQLAPDLRRPGRPDHRRASDRPAVTRPAG